MLEKELHEASPEIISYLMKNAKTIGEKFINYIQDKISEQEEDDNE